MGVEDGGRSKGTDERIKFSSSFRVDTPLKRTNALKSVKTVNAFVGGDYYLFLRETSLRI